MSLEKIPDVLRALADEAPDHVLIDAVAMMAHSLVRAAQDLGFLVRPNPNTIERWRAALRRVFPDDPLRYRQPVTARWFYPMSARERLDRHPAA